MCLESRIWQGRLVSQADPLQQQAPWPDMQSRERLPRREEERRLGLQRIRLASPVQAFNTEELFKTSNDGNRAAVAAMPGQELNMPGRPSTAAAARSTRSSRGYRCAG